MVVCVKQNNMSIFPILAETELRNPPKEIVIRVIDASCISLSSSSGWLGGCLMTHIIVGATDLEKDSQTIECASHPK